MRYPLTTIALASTLVLGGASRARAAQEPARTGDHRVVVQVADRTIVADDVREAVLAERRKALADGKLEAFLSTVADTLLQDMIETKLFAVAARERGLDRRDDVKRRIEAAIDNTLAEIEVFERLAAQPATDAALQEYFAGHPDQFRIPGRVHARHIVVRTREEAAAARTEALAGADFQALARDRNVDSTRTTGGDLGWVSRGVMVHPFEQALFALAAGGTSEVIQTSQGFHVIRVDEIEAGRLPELGAVKEQVRRALLEARMGEMRHQLQEKYPVVVHQDVLESLKK